MNASRVWGSVLVCVSLLSSVSCKRQPEGAGNALSAGQSASAPSNYFAWNLRTLNEAYDKSGKRSSKWDESAKRALTEFARSRARVLETNEPYWQIISTNCAAAVQAGCDDPLIAYLHTRFVLTDQQLTAEELARAYVRASELLEQSAYPDVRKFYASLRAAQQLKAVAGANTNAEPQIFKFRHAAIDHLLSALQDQQFPPLEANDACSDLLETLKINDGQYQHFYLHLEPVLFAKWPQESFAWLLKGQANTEMAWHARGGGFANTVTTQGWKGFEEHLKIADEALNKAWKLNPTDTRIPIAMLTVELGQGEGRDRMELWFERAMELDTNCYDAAFAKLYYLEPKWHGSVEDMLIFGRQCVASKKWGGRVPLVLADAHWSIYKQYNKEAEDYWMEHGVWDDLQAAFERFFELCPDAVSWRHNYAWYAYHCRQWDALNKQLNLFGPTNYEYFGGKSEFEKMVRAAKEHAQSH